MFGNMVKKSLRSLRNSKLLWCHHQVSRDRISFLGVELIEKGNQLVTDFCVKPTDTHQYLHASSSHVFHSKKINVLVKALKLNRICSKNCIIR